jgi:hypothetical protein
MYGIVPMIQVKKEGSAQVDSMIWANASDTFVDVFSEFKLQKDKTKRTLHWMSEAGSL